MKKRIAFLLVLILVLSFVGCGKEEAATPAEPEPAEALTAIPLGGSLEALDVTGPGYGTYVKTELLQELTPYMEEGDKVDCYYSEGSDTPYIVVWRFPKGDRTLQEAAAAYAETYGAADCQETAYLGSPAMCYQVSNTLSDGKYYYANVMMLEDGDDFVEIDYFIGCEEVALGDSGQYLWIPTGSRSLMNEDETAHGTIFYADYDPNYDLPEFWVGLTPESYKDYQWYWEDHFKELPFDQKTLGDWVKTGWDNAARKEYYEAVGYPDLEIFQAEHNGCLCDIYAASNDKQALNDLYISAGDTTYNVVLTYKVLPAPVYNKVLLESLHSK